MKIFLISLLVISSVFSSEVDIFDSNIKNIMFDTTGAHLGSGDILGPLNLANELIKRKSLKAKITIVYDDYGLKYLKDSIGKSNITFLTKEQAQIRQEPTDLLLSLFTPHRDISDFSKELENKVRKDGGYVFFGGSLHNSDGEILSYNSSANELVNIKFNSAGFGSKDAGVIWDPIVSKLSTISKQKQKKWALEQLKGHELERLILKIQNEGHGLGLVYGAKNAESFDDINKDKDAQLIKYLKYTQNNSSKHKNVYVLNPESPEVIAKALSSTDEIIDSRIRPLSIGRLTSSEFIALAILSDQPIAVEGDNSVSAIVRLRKKFMLLRSTWNEPVQTSLESMFKKLNVDEIKHTLPFVDIDDSKLAQLSSSIGYWTDYLISRISYVHENRSKLYNNINIESHIVNKTRYEDNCLSLLSNFFLKMELN